MKTKNKITSNVIRNILFNQSGNFMGGGEPGGDGGSGGDVPPAGGDSGNGGGKTYDYPSGLEESLHGNPSLLSFAGDDGKFDMAKLMKSYVHTKSMVGKTGVQVPDENFTDEQWQDFYNKIGRPQDASEYGIKNNVPEGIMEDKEFFEDFSKNMYDLGLLPKQAQAVSDYVNNFLGQSVKSSNEASELELGKARELLKSEWGDAYETKNKRAFTALQQFAGDDEIAQMQKAGLLDSPIVAKVFDKIAEGMLEDKFDSKSKGTLGMTPEQAREEINKMYQKDHPFMLKNHPHNASAQDKMLKLQSLLNKK